jgi:hypothetical protein
MEIIVSLILSLFISNADLNNTPPPSADGNIDTALNLCPR